MRGNVQAARGPKDTATLSQEGPRYDRTRDGAQCSSDGTTQARVLEIGGGIGTVQAELLMAGASSGEIVELVSAYEPYARELAHDRGIESQSAFRIADALAQPETVARADIVVLNRVVCCWPDGVRLTGLAAGFSRRILLVSYPRDRVLVRLFMRIMNRALRIMGRLFRVFVHPRASLYEAARAEGLAVGATGRTFAWEFTAFCPPV